VSPNPLIPKGQPPWLPRRRADKTSPATRPEAILTEEQLADYHASRLYRLSLGQTIACLTVLTIAAAVVILPFLYMLLISLKGPAEVGTGRILPEEIENFRTGRTAWIQVEVTAEQVAALGDLGSIPVVANDEMTQDADQAGRLPAATITARRLATESMGEATNRFSLLLDAPDPGGRLSAVKGVQVYIPAADQQWQPVPGEVRQRTLAGVAGRLLDNYKRLLNWQGIRQGEWVESLRSGYPRWYFNSLFVAFSTVLLGVFLDSLAAFAFAKYQFPFKRTLFALLIGTLMIPYPVTLVPTFFLFAKLGFYNTYAALIIPGVVSAFGIFLVRQYMETIPDDMLDAAKVDGAGDFQVYWKVILPAARPVLAALAVFRFIFQWNTYLYPLVLTNKDSMKTVQLGIATMEDIHGTVDHGLQMAGSAMAVLPILIVYMFMQKHFIAGITMGSSKG